MRAALVLAASASPAWASGGLMTPQLAIPLLLLLALLLLPFANRRRR